ncbi:hypothetical protein TrVFT333_010885 [Trichoderma virens FT-333]|nr:hypothetical protein TrVFT333_010885 [Trichoderma virens FT-333]
MSRSTFIAARNSRHRTAALALYRALLRTASRIPVAQDVAQKPITQIVRRRFEKNAGYTSFRLVYAAMAAGYKFLNLLTKAQTPNSSEHTQIMQHLQSVRDTAAASRAIPHPQQYKPVLPPSHSSSTPPNPTLPQNTLPTSFPGQRTCSQGPEKSPLMIGRKNRIFESRILNILDVDERVVPEAALEDDWDRMMDELLAEERSKGEKAARHKSLSRLWWELKIEKTWEDWIARGEALHHLVEQERTLAEQEQGGRSDAARRNNRLAAAPRRNALDYDDSPPNVGVSPVPSLPLLEAIRSSVPRDEELAEGEESQDPFLSPAWAALVKSQEGRMLKWAGKRVVGQRGD